MAHWETLTHWRVRFYIYATSGGGSQPGTGVVYDGSLAFASLLRYDLHLVAYPMGSPVLLHYFLLTYLFPFLFLKHVVIVRLPTLWDSFRSSWFLFYRPRLLGCNGLRYAVYTRLHGHYHHEWWPCFLFVFAFPNCTQRLFREWEVEKTDGRETERKCTAVRIAFSSRHNALQRICKVHAPDSNIIYSKKRKRGLKWKRKSELFVCFSFLLRTLFWLCYKERQIWLAVLAPCVTCLCFILSPDGQQEKNYVIV